MLLEIFSKQPEFLLCSTTFSFPITHLSLEVRLFRLINAYIKNVNWYSFIALVSSHQSVSFIALVSFHQGLKHEMFYTFIPLVSSVLLLFKSCHHYYLLPTTQISLHKRINILLFASFISPILYHGIARNLLIAFCSVLRATISYFCCLTGTIIFPTRITKNENHLDYVILVTFAVVDPPGLVLVAVKGQIGPKSSRPKVCRPKLEVYYIQKHS